MSQAIYHLHELLGFFREGFRHVNVLLGLLIALVFSWKLSHWKRLWAVAVLATLTHIAALILVPVIDHNAALRLPPLIEFGFWRDTLALYLGYVVVIAVFFLIRKTVLPRGGMTARAH